jgi:hypothetical protein
MSKYNFTDNSFCTQPFSNIQISAQGLYKICCMANDDADRGHVKDENGNYLHVLDHSIDSVFNSITHKEHRLQLSQDQKPERCINCYEKEQVGGYSVRSTRNDMKNRIIEIVDRTEADTLMKSDGSINVKPIALDIRFGSLCNAKCIMCNAASSSMWLEDAVKLYGEKAKTIFNINVENFGAETRWWESEQWWKQFEKIAPNLRSLYPVGGEPLIVPEHDTMLQKLVDWGYSKNIELEYDTNLTVINPKLIKLWKQFKNIVLRISIDETDDRYFLVRYPSKWNTLIKNIERLKAEGIPIKGFTSSIGLATIYSPFRLQKFSEEYNIPYFQRFLYTPAGMNVTILPPSAKEEIIRIYAKNPDITGDKGSIISKHLESNFDLHYPDRIKNFVKYMDSLDGIRNTNWKQTLPDIHDLLIRHCPDSFNN